MESKVNSTKESFVLELKLRFLKFLNLIMITSTFSFAWYSYYESGSKIQFYLKGDLAVIFVYAVLYYIFGRIYDAFKVRYSRISELVYSQILSCTITNGIMYLFVCLLSTKIVNILPGFGMFAVQIVMCLFWSYVVHRWHYKVGSKLKTVIIWDQRKGLKNLIQEYGLDIKYDVKKLINIKDIVESVEKENSKVKKYRSKSKNTSKEDTGEVDIIDINIAELQDVQVVFLAGIHSHDRNVILKYCVEHNIKVFVIPRVGDLIMASGYKMHMFHLPMLLVGRYNPNVEYLIAKRAIDIIVSLAMIIVFSPFMIITAILVKLDGGPILYKQERLTKDGKRFNVLKFRSMRVDAEKDGQAVLSSGKQDDRITKVGKVIRAIRFDELPQLFNILSGNMTIVGPRPERPEFHEKYCKQLPEFNLRLQCKAGLTGYAQVYGKYNTTPYDKLLMDLMYISSPSIWQDLAIIFATVKILFLKDSTEGVVDSKIKMFEE